MSIYRIISPRLQLTAKREGKKIGRNFRDCRQNVGKKGGEKRSRETARQAEKPHTHTAAIIFFLSPIAALASSVTLPLTSGLIVPEQRVLYQVYNTHSFIRQQAGFLLRRATSELRVCSPAYF